MGATARQGAAPAGQDEESPMSWTEERVEKLQELWNEGMSAAQIAKVLGGVTRNAVIGKVHRLGLSNRSQPAKAAPAQPQAEPAAPPAPPAAEAPRAAAEPTPPPPPAPDPEPEPEEIAAAPEPAPAAPVPVPARPVISATARREPAPMTEERLEALANLAELDKKARRLSLMELTERTCKWPIGDPTDEDFHFCGHPAAAGRPYCSAHCAIAYQPMSSRRDRDRARVRN
jgi:GcrA cell cycle regulator